MVVFIIINLQKWRLYIKILESLLTSSLEEAVNNMRELLHSCNISGFNLLLQQENILIIQQLRKSIDSDYATDLRLSEVARKLGITPEYLSSIFKKYMEEIFGIPYRYKNKEHAVFLQRNI